MGQQSELIFLSAVSEDHDESIIGHLAHIINPSQKFAACLQSSCNPHDDDLGFLGLLVPSLRMDPKQAMIDDNNP